MHKRLFQLLLFLLWFSLLSISVLASGHSTHAQATETVAQQTGSPEQTRETASDVVRGGQTPGSSVADKSRQTYQTVKEKGKAAATIIAETSRSAWKKTRQAGAAVAEMTERFGSSLAEKSGAFFRANRPQQQPGRQDI